ncbi:tyrosine-type recombinase/integrase, partial [Escherichia coli]|nr:tyrosine-type recombinase/integrase [Escherichia coli]
DCEAHLDSLFLGWGGHAHKLQVFAAQTIRARLKRFMLAHNIDWEVAPHQFRMTFARYVARSQLGDVRYLRDHFKHWTLDMTAIYAEDQVRDK